MVLERSDVHWELKPARNPLLFIECCSEARQTPGGDKERVATKMQRAEWDLLFK